MLRGHRTTYLSLFDAPLTVVVNNTPQTERRGRSEALVIKRNELLLHRYYYYIKIKGRQYQATLEMLENEVYLTQRTIVDAMQRNSPMLKDLNAIKPDLKYFKEKFPFMNW